MVVRITGRGEEDRDCSKEHNRLDLILAGRSGCSQICHTSSVSHTVDKHTACHFAPNGNAKTMAAMYICSYRWGELYLARPERSSIEADKGQSAPSLPSQEAEADGQLSPNLQGYRHNLFGLRQGP